MSILDKLNEQVNKHGVGSLSSLELAAWREGEKAAAELARLRTIEQVFFNIVLPDGFHQYGLYEECPECEQEQTHALGCKLAAALKQEQG